MSLAIFEKTDGKSTHRLLRVQGKNDPCNGRQFQQENMDSSHDVRHHYVQDVSSDLWVVPARLFLYACRRSSPDRTIELHYVGELDHFFVDQPFLPTYNFRVRWHCDECESEMACGFPM